MTDKDVATDYEGRADWNPDEKTPCVICGKENQDISLRNAAGDCIRICAECVFIALYTAKTILDEGRVHGRGTVLRGAMLDRMGEIWGSNQPPPTPK